MKRVVMLVSICLLGGMTVLVSCEKDNPSPNGGGANGTDSTFTGGGGSGTDSTSWGGGNSGGSSGSDSTYWGGGNGGNDTLGGN